MSAALGDRPLLEPSEDRLGYAPFAKMLAATALRGIPADGLVVGVFGAWGLGKTTILNFLEHLVLQDPDETTVVVRFNPWWFSGREDLTRRFFLEFERAVFAKRARNKELLSSIRRYADSIGSGVDGILQTLEPRLKWVGKAIAAVTRPAAAPSIVAVKDELNSHLKKDAFRIVVLIDDIDRLLPDDMLEVFQLVKAVGDLPNVIYVLAFDQVAATQALDRKFGDEFGQKYLEKIVQVQFDLPPPRRAALRELLSHRLERVLDTVPRELRDEYRLGQLYQDVLEPILKTPREVVRMVNAVSVTFPAVARDVNPVDFLGIELLRLNFPKAYSVVRSSASHFVGVHSVIGRLNDGKTKNDEAQFHEHWLSQTGMGRSRVESIVRLLFPGLLEQQPASNAIDARNGRRVCTEEHFEKYFQYGLASDELSRDEFLRIIASDTEGSVRSAVEELMVVNGAGPALRFREFLETLRDHLRSNGLLANPKHFLMILCQVGDRVVREGQKHEMFLSADGYLLSGVIEAILKHLPEAERLPSLRFALDAAGVSTVTRVATTIASQHGRFGERQPEPEEQRVLPSSADIDALQAYMLERIRAAATDATLWDAPWLLPVLTAWKVLGEEQAMRDWVARNTADDERLIRFLNLFVGVVQPLGVVPSRRLEVSTESIRAFFDAGEVRERLARINAKPDGSSASTVVGAVRKALGRADDL